MEKTLIGAASDAGCHHSAERMALRAIAACYLLSRTLAWFLGVQFAPLKWSIFGNFLTPVY